MNNQKYIGKKLIIKWNEILDGGKMMREVEIIFLITTCCKIPTKFISLINDDDFYDENKYNIHNNDKIIYENIFILKLLKGYHNDPYLNNEIVYFNIKDLEKYNYKII